MRFVIKNPREDAQILPARMFLQDLEVADAIFAAQENVLSAVAALGDVMRDAGEGETGAASHVCKICGQKSGRTSGIVV